MQLVLFDSDEDGSTYQIIDTQNPLVFTADSIRTASTGILGLVPGDEIRIRFLRVALEQISYAGTAYLYVHTTGDTHVLPVKEGDARGTDLPLLLSYGEPVDIPKFSIRFVSDVDIDVGESVAANISLKYEYV